MKTNLYQNKYRISSTRLRNWDYGWNAAYFVTICTKNRICYFGDINANGRDTKYCVSTNAKSCVSTNARSWASTEARLSPTEIGTIANNYWMQIPNHFPFVKLGVHVVMPNHVHGIVIIDKPDGVETQNIASPQGQNIASPKEQNIASPQGHNDASLQPKNNFGPQSQNLPSILRGYKSGVKTYASKHQIDFAWQARYHDHVVRSEKEYQRISEYIVNNPKKWAEDKFYHNT